LSLLFRHSFVALPDRYLVHLSYYPVLRLLFFSWTLHNLILSTLNISLIVILIAEILHRLCESLIPVLRLIHFDRLEFLCDSFCWSGGVVNWW